MSTPGHVHHHLLCHQREPNFPCASLEDPPKPAGRSGPSSYKTVAFALSHSGHKTLFQSSNNGISISLKFIGLVQSSPTDFQSQMFLVQNPQSRELRVGLRHSLLRKNLWSFNHPPVCEFPTWGYGTLLHLHHSYSSHCHSFIISSVVKSLFS